MKTDKKAPRLSVTSSVSYAKSEALIMEPNPAQLTVDERIKLVEDLWDSIAVDQGNLPITSAQKAELDSRLEVYVADKNRGRSAVEAVRDIRKQL